LGGHAHLHLRDIGFDKREPGKKDDAAAANVKACAAQETVIVTEIQGAAAAVQTGVRVGKENQQANKKSNATADANPNANQTSDRNANGKGKTQANGNQRGNDNSNGNGNGRGNGNKGSNNNNGVSVSESLQIIEIDRINGNNNNNNNNRETVTVTRTQKVIQNAAQYVLYGKARSGRKLTFLRVQLSFVTQTVFQSGNAPTVTVTPLAQIITQMVTVTAAGKAAAEVTKTVKETVTEQGICTTTVRLKPA
jgi:hypothetical protein